MFGQARLKLTLWYLLIVMLISMSFSAVLYKILTVELDRLAYHQQQRLERHFSEKELPLQELRLRNIPPKIFVDPELVEETKRRLFFFLVIINGSILVASGGLGYVLAGKTLKPIQEMVKKQNQFVADASHELRTPLTSLKTTMEVYLREKKTNLKEAKTVIQESIHEVNKLQSLSDSLLQLAQYQQPTDAYKRESLALSVIIQEAIKMIAPVVSSKSIKLEWKPTSIQIVGNRHSLVDLVVILLDNAVKYSLKHGRISLSTKIVNGFLILTIRDQGIGIPQQDIPYIFERFYRADTSRGKKKLHGYGLGLSIAKAIVLAHGGKIWVKSNIGAGSTFYVKFPL